MTQSPATTPIPTAPVGRLDGAEIAEALRLYELGEIRSVRELRAGSSGSPKALVECARGVFVLKRREPGRDDPVRVAFSHEVVVHLLRRGFGAPRLIGTRASNNSMAQIEDRVYELTVYVDAEHYATSPAQARDAGRRLGELHAHLDGFASRFTPDTTPHDPAAALERTLGILGDDAPGTSEARDVCARAREERERLGEWSQDDTDGLGVVHGDYHPGNLLFTGDAVACVFDFDNARIAPRRADLAQAMVQFALRVREATPGQWPSEPDLSMAREVRAGYRETAPGPDLPAAALGSAMAESLVMEWAQTASAGRLGGAARARDMLADVARTGAWLIANADKVADAMHA